MSGSALARRRVLVTGGRGFLGAPLCRELVAGAAEVHGCSRRAAPPGLAVAGWHVVDLASPGAARRLLEAVRPQVIFHLASRVTGSRELAQVAPTFAANLAATVELLVAATELGCERLVLAGSMEEPEEGAAAVPASPYAAAKWAASSYARMFHALYGTPVLLARIFMVYGPGQEDRRKLVPYVTESLLRGEVPQLSSGTRPVDWIFVDDVVAGLLCLAETPGLDGRTLDLGSGELHTVREVAERLAELVPGTSLGLGALADRPLEPVRRASLAATVEATGWRPLVSLDEGLRRTVDWYRARPTGSP